MGRWLLVSTFALAFIIAACTSSDPVTIAEGEGPPESTTTSAVDTTTTTTEAPLAEALPIVFADPDATLDAETLELFITGQELFNVDWEPAGAAGAEAAAEGLGPLFNAQSCAACHLGNGRRQVPPEGELIDVGLVIRLSVPGLDPVTGAPIPEPTYGDQVQDQAVDGFVQEGTVFTNYVTQQGQFADGTLFEIIWPTVNLRDRQQGPLDTRTLFSARIGAQLIGMGLLEAIPDEAILANADPNDADQDGISGRPNAVWNPITGQTELGRFGWKSNLASLEHQILQAFHGDIGITSVIIPDGNCTAGQTECLDAIDGSEPEVSDEQLEAITTYVRALAVPEPRTDESADAQAGEQLFTEYGCQTCHIPNLTTGDSEIDALANRQIQPYTDLLLHDMGFDMGDDRPDFQASGNEWRTAPLWGLGLVPVDDDRGLLHDGRARTIEEAILWHGGEGAQSRASYIQADLADRQLLIAFLESL